MSNYNSLDDVGIGDTAILGRTMYSWKQRTTLEKTLMVAIVLSLFVFLVIVFIMVVGDRKRADELSQCIENQKNPFLNVKVSQDLNRQKEISRSLLKNFDENLIKQHLRKLTEHYHPAGTPANMKVMNYIAQTWASYGLDVKAEEYKVLLSYPKSGTPNTVEVQQTTAGKWDLLSNGTSTKLGPPEALEQQRDEDAKLWWNAYAKDGTAVGPIVYVNYCKRDDFDNVTSILGTSNLTGRIVLCRYGWGWRGAKVKLAEEHNASGVILYLDPADFGPPKPLPVNFTFPASNYVPSTGAQRGSLLMTDGDPQTPLYPSKDYTFREFTEQELRDSNVVPNIPVLPVGFGVVQHIFQRMAEGHGSKAPQNFTGGLPNVTYYVSADTPFKITVHALTEQRTIKNVFGYVYGSEDPDELIILSNHVDAWTYGAQDPNSGTATGLALSHAITKTMNESGWRPRRTLVFCGWDAEEYSLVGSTEWAEQRLKVLQSRAVALINVDTAVEGNISLTVKSVPLLYRLIVNASKLVENPNSDESKLSRPYLYDSFKFYRNKSLVPGDSSVPYMSFPAGGSDHKPFLQYVGVPTADIRFDGKDSLRGYPLYHTMYELDWTMENLADPGFRCSKAIGQMWGEIVRNLADSLVIPFNVTDYAAMSTKYVEKLITILNETKDVAEIVENYQFVTQNVQNLSKTFLDEAKHFQSYVDYANSGAPVRIQAVLSLNRRLLELERAFITPRGIPDRPMTRHVIFANSIYDAYAGAYFAGVTDSLTTYAKIKEKSPELKRQWRKTINLQLTAVQYAFESALDVLNLSPGFSI